MNLTRTEELFGLAFAKPAAGRAACLDGACHGDPALRQRLDTLLAAHDQPETLLATQAAPAPRRDEFHESLKSSAPSQGLTELGPPLDAPDEAVGQMLGRYKLLERVGEGGCGVVYFGWAGPIGPSAPYYYRIHGPELLIEFDNSSPPGRTNGPVNHVHSVFRDPQNDYGEDLLKKHYEQSHNRPKP